MCPSCPGMGEGGVAVSGGGRDRGVSLLSMQVWVREAWL